MAEIASAYVSLLPSARGFGKKLTADVGSETTGAGRALGGGFGKAFAVGAASIAALGVGSIFKDAVKGASDLQQSIGGIEAVFKGSSGQMLSWSKSAATSVGLSRNEFNELGTLIGSQLKNGGTSMQDLGKKTRSLITMGADLSAMFGGTTKDAVGALSSALKGERDPIERYGVTLTQAKIDAEAASLGFKKVGGSLSSQAQQAATLSLVMKQTSDAHGKFAGETNTLAHQQQVLSAQWRNAKDTLGTAFLPVLTKTLQVVNGAFRPAMAGLGVAFGKVKEFLAPLIEQIKSFFSGPGGAGIASFTAGIKANLIPVLQQVGTIFATNVLPILRSFATFVVGTLIPAAAALWQKIAVNLKPIFDQLVVTFQTRVLPTVQRLLVKFREWQPAIQATIARIQQIAGKILVFASAVAGRVIPIVIRFAGFLISRVIPAVAGVIGIAIRVIGVVVKVGAAFVSALVGVAKFAVGVVKKAVEVVKFVGTIPGKIIAALGDVGSLLLHSGEKIIAGLVRGIKAGAGKVKDAVKGVLKGARKLLPFSPAKEGPFSGRGWTFFSGQSIVEGLADGIRHSGGKVRSALRTVLSAVQDQINSTADSVSSAFGSDLFSAENAGDFLKSLTAQNGLISKLSAAFKTLLGWGWQPGALSQMFQSGNAGLILSLADNQSLAQQSATQFNAVQSGLNSLGQQVGTAAVGLDGPITVRKLNDLIAVCAQIGIDVGDAINGAAVKGHKRGKKK